MLTFLEFYQTLLQFVNFKLYHSLSVHYPPVLDSKLEEAAAGLAAIMQDIAQHQPHKAGSALATLTGSSDNNTAGPVTADMQTLPTVVLDGLTASQAAAASVTPALTSADGSDDEAEEDVGEIDSGDEDDDDASASDEEAAAQGANGSIAEGEQNAPVLESGRGSMLHEPFKAVVPALQILVSELRQTECMQQHQCEVALFTAALFIDPFSLQFRFIVSCPYCFVYRCR